SPSGDPPFQFAALDQRSLAAPVQVCVAGVKRISSHSSWSRRAAFIRVRPRKPLELPLALFATFCHQVKAMLQLLSKEAATKKRTDRYAFHLPIRAGPITGTDSTFPAC